MTPLQWPCVPRATQMEGHASLTGLKASCEIDYQATGETRILKFGFDVGKAGDIGVELMKSMGEKVKSLMASLFKEWVEKQKRDRALFQSKMKANGDKLKAAARAAYEKRQANKKARRDAMKEAFRGRGLQATPTSSPTANPVATPTDGYGYGYGSLEDLLNSLMKAAANCTVNCSNFSMNSSAFNFSTAAGYGDDISAPDNNANALAVLRSIYGADYNSSAPTQTPTSNPTTGAPTAAPSASPTSSPSTAPSANPTMAPTRGPTTKTQLYSHDLTKTVEDTFVVWGPIMWVVFGATLSLMWSYFYHAYGGFCGISVSVEVASTGKCITLETGCH